MAWEHLDKDNNERHKIIFNILNGEVIDEGDFATITGQINDVFSEWNHERGKRIEAEEANVKLKKMYKFIPKLCDTCGGLMGKWESVSINRELNDEQG